MALGIGAAILGSSVVSGLLGNNAASDNSRVSQAQYGQTREDLAPYRLAGVNALNTLGNFNLEEDPGYQFARDEALGATSRYMGSRGFGNSGNILAALGDRAQGVGQQYYGDAWNRQFGLAGLGQNSAVQTGYAGQSNVGNQINANQFGAGSINNAIQGGLSNYLSYQGPTTNSLNPGYGQGNWASP